MTRMSLRRKGRLTVKNKIAAIILAFALSFALTLQSVAALPEIEDDTIRIETVDDLMELAKECRLDSWSLDKTVELASDIDLSGNAFDSIPTFGGRFIGNGHKISGLNIEKKGSYLGLFRYIQSSGYVEGINVSGNINPDGTKTYIGGIVGENRGTISNCTFSGSVEGEENIGGIAGYNTESGKIYDCDFYGSVTGETYTGGIAGQNFGHIELCENNGSINTVHVDKERLLEDINIDDISSTPLRSTENIDANTDTGGIVGYNKGEIRSCTNLGNVGYNHLGYNTGGIAGRQAGYIVSCENHGEIYGRKDVGGICGQAEPFVIMEFGDSTVKQLDDILFDIQGIIDGALDRSDNSVSNILTAITNSISDISTNAHNMSDSAVGYTEKLTDAANDLSGRVHTALDKSDAAMNDISSGSNKLGDALGSFHEACGYLEDTADELKVIFDDLDGTSQNASDAARYFSNASSRLESAADEMEDSLHDMKNGVSNLKTSLQDLKKSLNNTHSAENSLKNGLITDVTNIRDAFGGMESAVGTVEKTLNSFVQEGYADTSVASLADDLDKFKTDIANIKAELSDVIDELTVLADTFNEFAAGPAMSYIKRAFANISAAFTSLKKIADDLDGISENTDAATENGKKAIEKLREGLTSVRDASDFLSRAADTLSDAMETATSGGSITVPEIDDDFRSSLDGFFDSVDVMQEQFKALNNTITDKKDRLNDDLRDVNNELLSFTELLSDAYDDAADKGDIDDIIEDVSDSDTSGDTRGRTELCLNRGSIYGDINSGGIVGSMAIEYDFDPEDDIARSGEKTLNYTYKTKAVVRRCENSGTVNAKKNYGGGIVGRMYLGSLLFCEDYGDVVSEEGSYIGGIAGASDSIIRNSFSKCSISGKNYVGGIAGEGKTVSNCFALINIAASEEFSGAVAGHSTDNNIRGCGFVNPDLGGIDGISYKGIAEERGIKYAADFLRNSFNKNLTFNLTFTADGETVGTVPFEYGESISDDMTPVVPEKDGYYGRWSDYDFDSPTFDAVIEAVYYRAVEIIESEQKRENERPVVMVCGSFDDLSSVKAEESDGSAQNAEDAYLVDIDDTVKRSSPVNYKVRYLPKLGADKADIYVECGGNIQKVKTEKVGSYLEFETPENSFKIYETGKSISNLLIIIIIALIAVILIAAAIIIIKKQKKA